MGNKNYKRVGIFCLFVSAVIMIILSFSLVAKADYNITSEVNQVAVANGADLVSTGMALTLIEGAVEANPLSWGLIPAKIAVNYGVMPYLDKPSQVVFKKTSTSVTYAAVANNAAVIAGVGGAVPIFGGIAVGAYLLACGFDVLPESVCIVGGSPTGSVAERLEKLTIRAKKEGRIHTGFVLSEEEARELFREYEYCRDTMLFMGKTLEIDDERA